MAAITTFLPPSAFQRMEMQKVVSSHLIDFSKGNAQIADTVQVLEIPPGLFVTRVLLAVHTTEATVTIAVGDLASGTQFLAAQTLTDLKADNVATTADGVAASADTTEKFYGTTAEKLVLTIGGAAATTAVVSVVLEGTLVAKTNYDKSQSE